MEDLNDEQRKNKLFLLVHGNGDNEDLLSLNSLFLCGRKQFESVFDREIINVTDDDASTNEVLVLREVLHRQKDIRYTVARDCISADFISSSTLKGRKKVEGRTIKNNSELAKKNALKCIGFAKAWMNGKDELPSGQSWDDMYEHVYTMMELHLKGKTLAIDDEGQTGEAGGESGSIALPQQQPQASSNPLFPGWMVFVLYGPFGPDPRMHVDWLQESPDERSAGGRMVARRSKAKRESEERSMGIGNGPMMFGRGMTFDQRAFAVAIAQREESDTRKQHVQDVMELQIDIQNLINQKGQELKLMEMMGGSLSPSFQDSLRLIAELDAAIREKTNSIEELKKERNTKRQKKNPMVQSLLQSILASDVLSPNDPPIRSVTTTTTARSTSQHDQRSSASSIPPLGFGPATLPLRPSPAAMSTLTGDDNFDDNDDA